MTSSSYIPFIWMSVQQLIPMVGFWIGVIALRQTRSGVIWWFMLFGVFLTTIGIIASSVVAALNTGAHYSSKSMFTLQMVSITHSCAWILFAISFAIHAFAMVRLAKRAQELEGVCAAMSAEIQKSQASLPGEH